MRSGALLALLDKLARTETATIACRTRMSAKAGTRSSLGTQGCSGNRERAAKAVLDRTAPSRSGEQRVTRLPTRIASDGSTTRRFASAASWRLTSRSVLGTIDPSISWDGIRLES